MPAMMLLLVSIYLFAVVVIGCGVRVVCAGHVRLWSERSLRGLWARLVGLVVIAATIWLTVYVSNHPAFGD